jgi:hypothetical protein
MFIKIPQKSLMTDILNNDIQTSFIMRIKSLSRNIRNVATKNGEAIIPETVRRQAYLLCGIQFFHNPHRGCETKAF